MLGLFRFLLLLLILGAAFVLWPIGVPDEAPHDTLIVLGAAQYSGRPSPAFRVRLDHALELYQAGGIRTIVVTGGRIEGDPYTEGGVGTAYLYRQGVPRSALLAEERSRTTEQNLNYAAKLVSPGTSVTIVTDRVHAPRALAMARDLGMDANASPSALWQNVSPRYLLREKAAWLAYQLFGYTGQTHSEPHSG
ncbi:YdcF family protein [Deinococcus radiophilus]|uniref:YdcF family protein n=1 Tax=Deinococcus radiophilus TaxID=32062 RepID=A0A431VX79_9DEIO|nr:YdcF family protein [Deinococcus radiophilus]RTR27745.1 YdcF family protein [Deinococcus radiophilus]UFA50064.1 YdcF family protein [Deinococcus radiophilus]